MPALHWHFYTSAYRSLLQQIHRAARFDAQSEDKRQVTLGQDAGCRVAFVIGRGSIAAGAAPQHFVANSLLGRLANELMHQRTQQHGDSLAPFAFRRERLRATVLR